MQTIAHPATGSDLRNVARIIGQIYGTADSGQALLGQFGEPAPTFATRPFRSGSVRGQWVTAPGAGGDSVLLYVHGRRFQFDEPPGVYSARLSAATRLPVLHLDYRLAPEHPYPAALDDVAEAYQALRDAGRPMPAAAIALSPLTDFTFSGESVAANDGRDVISQAELGQVASAYLASADPAGAPQSPLAGDCSGLPPLLIACGEAEVLRDDAVRFAHRAAAAGVPVDLEIFGGMPHGFPALSLDASERLLTRIATFTAAATLTTPLR